MTVDTTQESTLLQSYDINLKFKHDTGKPHEHLSETSNSSKGSWLKNEEIKLSWASRIAHVNKEARISGSSHYPGAMQDASRQNLRHYLKGFNFKTLKHMTG